MKTIIINEVQYSKLRETIENSKSINEAMIGASKKIHLMEGQRMLTAE